MRMETYTVICLVFSLVAIVLSLVNLFFNVVCFVELRSFMKSTHKVEFVPLEGGPESNGRNFDDILKGDLGVQ